jgi:hypothetical protein
MDTSKIRTLFRIICVLGFLQLLTIGVLVSAATQIDFGETVNGTINSLGQMDDYRFTAAENDTIYTRMNSEWYDGALIILKYQDGTGVATAPGGTFTNITKSLPLSGEYTLQVGDIQGNDKGMYGLYLQRTNNPGQTEQIAFGETRTGTITKRAQLANYTFIATQGNAIYTRMNSAWYDGALIRLYAPNGTEIATAPGGIFTHITTTLPLTGEYTLLAGDILGDDTGDYGLYCRYTAQTQLPAVG